MRAVLQRVSSARVRIDGAIVGEIGTGLLVLLGVEEGDTPADGAWMAEKIIALRIFEDADGRMNRSLRDLSADAGIRSDAPTLLVVSQFTLLADTRKGTRPSFNDAAKPDVAIPLYESFVRQSAALLGRPVATGRFGAMMSVELANDGPVTIVIDSKKK